MNNTCRVFVNGVPFVPQTMGPKYSGVDYDSGRTADATMHRNMIGEKQSYTITLPPMHTADLKPIIQAISGTSNQSFIAAFPYLLSEDSVYVRCTSYSTFDSTEQYYTLSGESYVTASPSQADFNANKSNYYIKTPNGYYMGEFYSGDRDLPIYNFALDLYDSASFSIIEV